MLTEFLMLMSYMPQADMCSCLEVVLDYHNEVLQADYHNEVYNGSRTCRIRHCWAKAKWLHELLMDLPVVEKPIPAISMNYDN